MTADCQSSRNSHGIPRRAVVTTDVTTVSDKIKEEPKQVFLPSHFLCSLNSVLSAQLTHVLPDSSCIKLYFFRIKLQWKIISRNCIASQKFRPLPCREDNVHAHQYLYSVCLRTEIFFSPSGERS